MEQIDNSRLRLMVFQSALELGKKVEKHLQEMYGTEESFILPIKENFFSDGHLKVEINDTVRGKDVFFLTDVGNCSITYNMRGYVNHMSPNDWIMELKDGIGACNCHARSIHIITPLLYAGRQHRRKTRENLMCGMMLHELEEMSGMKTFITFDAHDPGVEHALHKTEFDNFFATNVILEEFINNLPQEELEHLAFIAPDNGAVGRRDVYLNSFNSSQIDREAGSFIKKRDYNNLVDGKYPVIEHLYSGNSDLTGYTAIVSDDMISSGGSMFDVMEELKRRNAKKIYLFVTYALFANGIDKFDEYYEKGMFDGIYTTNLSYIPEEYQQKPWLHVCDCSKLLAEIIYNIHNDKSISGILRDKSYPVKLLEKKFSQPEQNK